MDSRCVASGIKGELKVESQKVERKKLESEKLESEKFESESVLVEVKPKLRNDSSRAEAFFGRQFGR
jgi:hypothetical protein